MALTSKLGRVPVALLFLFLEQLKAGTGAGQEHPEALAQSGGTAQCRLPGARDRSPGRASAQELDYAWGSFLPLDATASYKTAYNAPNPPDALLTLPIRELLFLPSSPSAGVPFMDTSRAWHGRQLHPVPAHLSSTSLAWNHQPVCYLRAMSSPVLSMR